MKNILVGLLATVSSLILLEGALRVFWSVKWPQDMSSWEYTEDSGYKCKPGTYDCDKSPAGFTGTVNTDGYRDKENSDRKADIICVGDSVVLGLRSKVEGGDFSNRLEKIVGRDVLNAGVGGNTSSQVLYRLKHELLGYKPKLVIVSVGSNDWSDFNPGIPKFYHADGLMKWIANRSYTVRAFLGLVYKVVIPAIPVSEKEALDMVEKFNKFEPSAFKSNLYEMVSVCHANGTRIVFCTIPAVVINGDWEFYKEKIRVPYWAREYNLYKNVVLKYNAAIEEVGKETGVQVVDMALRFSNLPEPSKNFEDNVHLNDDGYRQYAEELARRISR